MTAQLHAAHDVALGLAIRRCVPKGRAWSWRLLASILDKNVHLLPSSYMCVAIIDPLVHFKPQIVGWPCHAPFNYTCAQSCFWRRYGDLQLFSLFYFLDVTFCFSHSSLKKVVTGFYSILVAPLLCAVVKKCVSSSYRVREQINTALKCRHIRLIVLQFSVVWARHSDSTLSFFTMHACGALVVANASLAFALLVIPQWMLKCSSFCLLSTRSSLSGTA